MARGYTSYVLSEESRNLLLETFAPKYPDVIAHHITNEFDVTEVNIPDSPQDIKVVGLHDSGKIQVLSIELDGRNTQLSRGDGEKRYLHVTFSLDRSQGVAPKDSNTVLHKIVKEHGEGALQNLSTPIHINATPKWTERKSSKKAKPKASNRILSSPKR